VAVSLRGSIVKDVDWSPAYIAFIVYVFVITTYRLQLGTESMVVALVLLPLERKPLRLPSLTLWTLAFLGWAFIGWGASPYPDTVWNYLTEYAKICGVTLVAVNVLTSRARLRFFLLAFLAFFAFYPVRGSLFSYFIYGGTVLGRAAWNYVYNNPNDLAALCLLPLALAAGMLITERQRWIRYCAAAGALVLPLVILLPESRGAIIALVFFALAVLRGQKKRRGKILLVAAVVGAVIVAVAPANLWTRIGSLSQVTSKESAANAKDDMSARQRLEIWSVAGTIAKENIVTGVGLGAYPDVHYLYAQRPIFDPIAMGHRDTHSTYLRLLAENGIVGFTLFMLMVFMTGREAERTRRKAVATMPAKAAQLQYMEFGLAAYFVAGIWATFGMLVLTYLYLAIMYATTELLKADLAQAGILPVQPRMRAMPRNQVVRGVAR
jgi:probable O-glycosylation ligase (exosortase A-associated)